MARNSAPVVVEEEPKEIYMVYNNDEDLHDGPYETIDDVMQAAEDMAEDNTDSEIYILRSIKVLIPPKTAKHSVHVF